MVAGLQRSALYKDCVKNRLHRRTVLRTRVAFWCFAIAVGFLQAWAQRNTMNPDGISYIEIAHGAETNWHALVNGYWSPLYPLVLSVVFRLVRPSPYWEFTAVHFVNFAIYLISLGCFEWFLRELLAARSQALDHPAEIRAVSDKTLWLWGCVFFLWASRYWLSLVAVTPDLCIAGLVYLATALLLRLQRGKNSRSAYVLFGAVLGTACLAKTALFTLSPVYLFSAYWATRRWRGAILGTALAGLALVSVAGPFVFALSKAKNRTTFGDAGRISYAEFVGGVTRSVHWHGEPPGSGRPLHPTRLLLSFPALFEFAHPVPGSYPPWYDPSYWYEGVLPRFSVKGQIWSLYRAANAYLKMFSRTGTLYLVLLTVALLVKQGGAWRPATKAMRIVWLPTFVAMTLYALVLVEPRYLAGFILTLLLGILAGVRVPPNSESKSVRCCLGLVAIAPMLSVAWACALDVKEIVHPKPFEQWGVAHELRQRGVAPGDSVGYIGTGRDAYWGHLAQLRIVAEVPDFARTAFVHASTAQKTEVLRTFGQLGVKAVLTKHSDVAHSTEGWQQIAGSRYFVWWPAASSSALREPRTP